MLVEPKTQTKFMEFFKMNALGNDFIIIDNRKNIRQLSITSIIKLCDRKNIGCDQLVIINKPNSNEFHCELKIFNNDGSLTPTCGNATRCIAGLLFEEDLSKNKLIIKTDGGIIECFKISEKHIKVNMGSPYLINNNLFLENFNFTHIDIGNPHAITFINHDISDKLFLEVGDKVENNLKYFPNKTNVEFAKIINDNLIEVRVYERGAKETLACGSGACAVAYASIINHLVKSNKITIKFKGGELLIEFDGKNIFMIGTYQKIYNGIVDENFL
jgi:diaminopimelate epimerase